MKPWERSLLEYRPNLGYTPAILSTVLSKPQGSAATFTPSALAIQTTQILGSDLIDNTMATLSRVSNMLTTLNRCQSADPIYAAYRTAKDAGDEEEARRIHLENVQNIDGNPQLDAVPILEQCRDEMEEFLDYINRELFDGKADMSDMERTREQEEKFIDTIFFKEANGKAVSYEELVARIRIIAACVERMQTFQNTVDMSEAYLMTGVKNAVAEDAEGLLYYLSEAKESDISAMQTAVKVSFNGPASQAVMQIINAERAGDREFRSMLDQQLSSMRKTYLDTYRPLLPYFADDTISMGAQALRGTFYSGMEAISTAFEELTADHMATSLLNRTQTQGLFANLTSKKMTQLLYQLLRTYVDEFDPVNVDKEVKRFTKHHGLDRDGTLCG